MTLKPPWALKSVIFGEIAHFPIFIRQFSLHPAFGALSSARQLPERFWSEKHAIGILVWKKIWKNDAFCLRGGDYQRNTEKKMTTANQATANQNEGLWFYSVPFQSWEKKPLYGLFETFWFIRPLREKKQILSHFWKNKKSKFCVENGEKGLEKTRWRPVFAIYGFCLCLESYCRNGCADNAPRCC